MKKISIYNVIRLKQIMTIDANWNKPQWQNVPEIHISNYMGNIPGFCPVARVKLMYNQENIYVIFNVFDQYFRCLTKDINGSVWEDSCVEFFFSPNQNKPECYFNLEINCGGTPLMHYNTNPGKKITQVGIEDIKTIEIAHTLPEIIDLEIIEPVNWTIEYRIPLDMLEKYSSMTRPGKGTEWKANFYKISENNSNPHYITWAHIDNSTPDFHLPQFFETIRFE